MRNHQRQPSIPKPSATSRKGLVQRAPTTFLSKARAPAAYPVSRAYPC